MITTTAPYRAAGDLGDAFYIEAAGLPERKYLIMVGQQCVRLPLGIGSGGNELGLANGGAA